MNDTQQLPQQCDPQPFGLSERLVRAIRERECDWEYRIPNPKCAGEMFGLFPWDDTPEGMSFWEDVYECVDRGACDFTPEQFAQLKPAVKAEEPKDGDAGYRKHQQERIDYAREQDTAASKPALDPKDAKMIDSDKRAMSPKEAAWAARQVPVIAQPTPTPAPCCGLTTVAQITHRMGAGK